MATLFLITIKPTRNQDLKRETLFDYFNPMADQLIVGREVGLVDNRTPFHFHVLIKTKEPRYLEQWNGKHILLMYK